MDYKVDIVMCIDVSRSMQGCIDTLKDRAKKFWPDLQEGLKIAKKDVSEVRVKVIAFRDFSVDADKALHQSEFFRLSDQDSNDNERYERLLDSLVAEGGGKIANSSLEVLGMAMKDTDWVQTGDRQRHIIIVFTESTAWELEEAVGKDNPLYPKNGPTNMGELYELWNPFLQEKRRRRLKQSAKRLVLFAPSEQPWADIRDYWNQVVGAETEIESGLDEVKYDEILNAIICSV